jgi:hypothetical protein
MAQEFTGADFAKALAAGTLNDHILCEGMAKTNESDPHSILFTTGLDCGKSWFPIPVKMVEKVEFLRNVSCKDHQHPYVRIHLKSPTDNPDAEVFSRLLAAYSPPCELCIATVDGSGNIQFKCFEIPCPVQLPRRAERSVFSS